MFDFTISIHHLLMSLSCVLILISGCSRSPLAGSANYDCGEGDRVISVERLFCVYTSARRERPEMIAGEESESMPVAGDETPAGTGTISIAGEENQAGTEFTPGAGEEVLAPFCPAELPVLYTYDTLYICAPEEGLSIEVIEAVVAAWSSEYFSADMVPADARDQGVTDEGIGVVIEPMVRDATISP